jgi:hypothetical protein
MKRRIYYSLKELGIDPVLLLSAPRNLLFFLRDLVKFKSQFGLAPLNISLALRDRFLAAGNADGHYFWQDLIVAQRVYVDGPVDHLDVGSRIDGFITHLAVFMKVYVMDIRPLVAEIPNVSFIVGNAQDDLSQYAGRFASVSSLHSVEHFGLGRYGDPINAKGHEVGLLNIASCTKVGGKFYVSFPIGREITQFNAQRILDPNWVCKMLKNFELLDFIVIPWKGQPIYGSSPIQVSLKMDGQAGIYCFKRLS